MKGNVSGIVLCLALLGAASVAYCQEPFKSSLIWKADDVTMVVENDSVVVNLTISLPNDGVAKKKAVVLQPCLESGGKQALLQPLSVYRMDQRGNRARVRSKSKYATGNAREKSLVSGTFTEPVVLSTRLARKSWMDSCEVKVLAMEWSWKDRCNLGQWTKVATLVRPPRPDFHPVYPLEEPVKDNGVRRVVVPLYLEYPSNGTSVSESFRDNRERLEDCVASLVNLIGDSHVSVSGIQVKGWTSPEGSASSNAALCQKRLTSLLAYLRKKEAFCGQKAASVCCGEDWDGMLEWIEGSYWHDDKALISLLQKRSDRDVTEKALRQSFPKLWEDLTERCFPALCRFDVEISFSTADMGGIESIWRAYKSDMRILSPHDFWLVAGRFPIDSEEWLDIVMDGADLYPDNEALNLNAACALMKIGRHDRAVEYLRGFTGSERGKLVNALWLMSTGRLSSGCREFTDVRSSNPDVQRMKAEAKRIGDWLDNSLPWVKD